LVTFAASAAATIQNYASADRGRPAWLTPALTALAGIVVGALLLGALVQPAPAATGAASTINGVPAVHLGTGFDETSITIPVGSRLIFADDAGIVHILAYGSWDSNRSKAEAQPAGAPPLNNLRVSSGNVEVGPFTAGGTYHIYCVVHPGMNLTVIVQ
jgi:plastocyanin